MNSTSSSMFNSGFIYDYLIPVGKYYQILTDKKILMYHDRRIHGEQLCCYKKDLIKHGTKLGSIFYE